MSPNPYQRGEIAGADIDATRSSTCAQCKHPVMLGLVRNSAGTLKWRKLEGKPIERDGRRFYLRHACPR